MIKADNIIIRRSKDRGHVQHGWLESYHTFSFADYHDRNHMSFRTLRVINEDHIHPGEGFGAHPHKDMEIVTYIISGKLEHKDSIGNGSVIQRGEIQKFSAGTGVVHSEFNASKEEPVHLLQVWIMPKKKGVPPAYDQLNINDLKDDNGLTLFASGEDSPAVVKVQQDVKIYRGLLKKEQRRPYTCREGRGIWIQVVRGTLEVGGHQAEAGDGVAIEHTSSIMLKGIIEAEFLLFDLK